MSAILTETVPLSHTPEQLADLVKAQQAFFQTGITRSHRFRMGQLGVLKAAIRRYEPQIMEALRQDLGKCGFEAYGSETGPVLQEISHMEKSLRGWMQPKRVPTPLMLFPTSSRIVPEPRGTTLIIAPWNYPVQLTFMPLAISLAAGNTVILKPSEEAPATEAVIREIISSCFEPELVAVITGPGQAVSEHLITQHHLDLVFFTGSPRVGSQVMQAAARQLSPVVLELGGKSPAIVAEDASIDYAARKVLFAKMINAGQTCIAPDYVLVHESRKADLIRAMKAYLEKAYGSNPHHSAEYGRIINEKHFLRLQAYLSQGRTVHGGDSNLAEKYMAPTIMDEVPEDAPLLQEEIFGPILPIVTYRTNEEARAFIEKRPYPLALYVFSNQKATTRYFTENIRFGGGCINNGLVHIVNPNLPFSGVGYSGMGNYHGRFGFQAFSHLKALTSSPTWIDYPMWYPPYRSWYDKALRWLMR